MHESSYVITLGAWDSSTCCTLARLRVVGCGDMSGDVFGNGMLLSKATMRAEGLDQQVEKYLKVKDDKVAAFVKQLTERLFAQHAKD